MLSRYNTGRDKMCMLLYSGGSNETDWQFNGKTNSPY